MLLIRSLVFLAFGAISVALGALLVLLTFWAPSRVHWAITVGYCRLAVWAGRFFCGMDPVVEGLENLPDEPSVIMIKHTSMLETYWHVTVFPKTAWVIKHEVMWVPLLGWAMKLMLDPIFINRSAGRSAVKQVIEKGRQEARRRHLGDDLPRGHAHAARRNAALRRQRRRTRAQRRLQDRARRPQRGRLLGTAQPHQAARQGAFLHRAAHRCRRARPRRRPT